MPSSYSWVWIALLAPMGAFAAEPLALHPDNPHYFIHRGRPLALITSAEHYGAVLNLDFNFHYASPPEAVALNAALNKVIGDNETGFKGTGDDHYRREGWEFLLAGGGLYNNLDYSFVAGQEDGTFQYPDRQPGGGNPAFRKQMKVLSEFIHGFDFIKMKPHTPVGVRGAAATVHALSEPGRQYALYVRATGHTTLVLDLPPGKYTVEWIDPISGQGKQTDAIDHVQGERELAAPDGLREAAVRILAVKEGGNAS